MKLVNYGVGEISDRLSILALKVLHADGRDVTHWRTEQTTLLAQLRSRELNAKWFEAYTELAATNAAIWYAEDDLRSWRQRWAPTPPDSTGLRGPGEGFVEATAREVAQVAFRIQTLNDRRAELVTQINKEAGDFAGSEKLTT